VTELHLGHSKQRTEKPVMISSFPGIMVSKATFCGLLAKAWKGSVTSQNILSGLRACGIFPFHPEAVPSEAYQPNLLYSLRSSYTTTNSSDNNESSSKTTNMLQQNQHFH